jgi:ABC-type multidrug transport system ATPase subunit
LTKHYGVARIFADVNLEVAAGECVGVAGINGSGRSTLMRTLATLQRPSSGTLQIDGVDVERHLRDARRRLAFAGSGIAGAEGLTAIDYLRTLTATRQGTDRPASDPVTDTLARAGVQGDALVDTLSDGLRQRLALATALSCSVSVLILDDACSRIDSEGRNTFLRWIRERRDTGTAIVITSNDEAELRMLSHRLLRLENGRLVKESSSSTRTVGV